MSPKGDAMTRDWLTWLQTASHEEVVMTLVEDGSTLTAIQDELKQSSPRADGPVWQPIETAPKDGTNILLSDGVTVSQGGWVDAAALGVSKFEAHLVCEDWWSVDMIEHPTLWQPMPSPKVAAP